jgi:hypothetical protein
MDINQTIEMIRDRLENMTPDELNEVERLIEQINASRERAERIELRRRLHEVKDHDEAIHLLRKLVMEKQG